MVETSPQNARDCTIFFNFLWGGGMPPNPPSNCSSGMYIQIPKKIRVAPPPEKSCLRPWFTNNNLSQTYIFLQNVSKIDKKQVKQEAALDHPGK